jgi:hypothetical protein
MHTPPRAGILPLRRAQPSSRRNYYLGFPQHLGKLKPLEVGNVPLTQERHSRLIQVPIKQKARPAKPSFFLLPRRGHYQSLPDRRKYGFRASLHERTGTIEEAKAHVESAEERSVFALIIITGFSFLLPAPRQPQKLDGRLYDRKRIRSPL